MQPSASVAIVMVNFNTRLETSASLRSLIDSTAAPIEAVVVDNGSTDGSVDHLRETFPSIRVIDARENLGFAAGVNLGVSQTTSPWVLLLNPDTIVLDGAIDALLDHALAHPENRIYGGRTLRPDGTTDPSSCWGAMSLWSLLCFATGLSTVFARSALFDPESLGRWGRDSVREVPIVTGCLLLVSREDWDGLGGMDEAYFLYGEDADFSARARRRGMRPVVVPDATIIHAVGGSTRSSSRKMSLVMAGKATILRSSWSLPAASIGLALLQAGVALRACAEVVRRATDPTWVGVWRARRDWRPGYPAARDRLFAPATPHHHTDEHHDRSTEGARK